MFHSVKKEARRVMLVKTGLTRGLHTHGFPSFITCPPPDL